MGWPQGYMQRTSDRDFHAPVYVAIVGDGTKGWLRSDFSPSLTAVLVSSDSEMGGLGTVHGKELKVNDEIVFYNSDDFEFVRIDEWNQAFAYAPTITRGLYGTASSTTYVDGARIVRPEYVISSAPVPGAPGYMLTGMELPSGLMQEIDPLEGRTRVDDVILRMHDHNGAITSAHHGDTIIGKDVIVLGGYEGDTFGTFAILFVGKAVSFSIEDSRVYAVRVSSAIRKLKRRLFEDVEDFSGVQLTSSISDTDVIGNVNTVSTLHALTASINTQYDPNDSSKTLVAGQIAKIGSELAFCDATTETTVFFDFRGVWGTTAASHAAGSSLDLGFGFEGNPIDFLLGLILSAGRDDESNTSFSEGKDNPTTMSYTWLHTSSSFGGTRAYGLGVNISDVDTGSFISIRDNWFKDYVWRILITKKIDAAKWIPKYLLKPLGLNLSVTRSGQIALVYARPSVDANPVAIDNSKVRRVSRIDYTNDEIVNVVTVNYDYDAWTDTWASTTTVIDTNSQGKYDVEHETTIYAWGMDTVWRGDALATRLGNRKKRIFTDPNPALRLSLPFSSAGIEVGQVVQVTLSDIADPIRGSFGWDRQAIVVSKSVRWDRGEVELTVIDSRYFAKRYGLVAKSGQADFLASTDQDHDKYVFVTSSTTGRMGDGSDPYLVM